MTASAVVEECELCQEVALGGTFATFTSLDCSEREAKKPFSRLIQRTTTVDVIAGLGGIIPGYVLLVPRQHVSSTGALGIAEVKHIYDLAWETAELIKAKYSCEVVLVEHGSSAEQQGNGGGSCITHSHIHLFPVKASADIGGFVHAESFRVRGYSQLIRLATSKKDYYYCARTPYEGYLLENPKLRSQHARQVWANLVREPDRWDWAVFPYLENCRSTTLGLRRDALNISTSGSQLGETIQAYTDSADWYAERTAEFPPNSSLPIEIKSLLQTTSGPVLDAGTGGGRDAQMFRAAGREVVGLDFCGALLERVDRSTGIHLVQGDTRSLPFADSTFGVVWCSAVLLHLDPHDTIQSMSELCRVLTSEGVAQISIKGGQGHSLEPIKGGAGRRHYFYYEPSDLLSFAHVAGFDVIREWTVEEADFADTTQRWIKILARKGRAE